MADPKAPEMPEGWEYLADEHGQFFINERLKRVLSMGRIRELLATQDLHIVSEADRKVLEACAAFPIEALHSEFNAQPLPTLELRKRAAEASWQWATAELARRSGT